MGEEKFQYDPMPTKLHSFGCEHAVCDCPMVESTVISVTAPAIGCDVHEISLGPEVSMFIDFGNGLEKVTREEGVMKITPVDWFGGR